MLRPVTTSALAAQSTPELMTPPGRRRAVTARRRSLEGVRRVPAGLAAGQPATAEVGLRILAAGGSAADAAVAAVLTCSVAESVLTGIGGGGFATYYDASTRSVT